MNLLPPPTSWALALVAAAALPALADTRTAGDVTPGAATTGDPAAADATALLEEARRLYEALDYDRVIPLAEATLAHPDTTVDERLDAYLLQGSSLAIVGNPIDAEKPFRFLLRGRPEFDMSAQTPPKILAVFRKVQVEERTIRDQMRELERRVVVDSLVIEDAEPREAKGGRPAEFDVVVRDPRGGVAAVSVAYRRAGDARYSSLPLTQSASGRWLGSVPGEWTENDEGFVLEYYLSTADKSGGVLAEVGTASAPLQIDVSSGSVADGAPFYTTFWFWGLTGLAAATVVASASAVGFVASQPPPSDLGVVQVP